MRSWERLSASIFRIAFRNHVKIFEEKSPEAVLKKSMKMLDEPALNEIRAFVRSRMHPSGGFVDKAGKPDLYYTLFGFFISNSFGLKDELLATKLFVEDEVRTKDLDGIHLHCAAILAAGLSIDEKLHNKLRIQLRKNLKNQLNRQPAYRAFVTLLACWYLKDYRGLLKVRRELKNLDKKDSIPSTVIAALMVLQASFNKSSDDLKNRLPGYYVSGGGFRALKNSPIPDLLSTAVVLYGNYFNGNDVRMIKPDCLNFVDSLYLDGGFGGNQLDPDPDIEYTFYGLLALGSLAE